MVTFASGLAADPLPQQQQSQHSHPQQQQQPPIARISATSHANGSIQQSASPVSTATTSTAGPAISSSAAVSATGASAASATAPVRPTPNRVPSNTYAPQRHPALAATAASDATRRNNRSSSASRHTSKRRQQQSSMSSTHVPRATDDFQAQQQYYLQKMRDDLDDEYYTRSIAQAYDFDYEDENTPSLDSTPSLENLGSDVEFDFDQANLAPYGNVTAAITPTREIRPSSDELQNPKNRERLEWQAMLTSVLTGEVVRSEKRKLQTGQNKGAFSPETEIWIEIRSRVFGRSFALQRQIIIDARRSVDQLVEEVLNFRIRGKDECPDPPEKQIKDILRKVENCENLYRNSRAMRRDKPSTASPAFQSRCEALIAWVTVSESIHSQIQSFKRWTGNDDLDLTRLPEADPTLQNAAGDGVPFIERIFKESDLDKIFKSNILTTLQPLIARARETTIEQGQQFAAMHLPSYLEDLLILLNFPTRLIQEVMRTRVLYARNIQTFTMKKIDQTLEEFKVFVQLALNIKREYLELSEPKEGWELPTVIDENFDNQFLDALKFYLELLNRKLIRSGKGRAFSKTFRETEFAENEYNFFDNVGMYVESADLELAEQFCALAAKLSLRITNYFELQLKGPIAMSQAELDRWYLGTIEHVRGFHRKLLRFSRILDLRYENASEFSLDVAQTPRLLDKLVASGHFLVKSPVLMSQNIYMFGSNSLISQSDYIRDILRPFLRRPEPDDYSYILIMVSSEPLQWRGASVDIDVPELQLDLKPGRLRLVADGAVSRLVACRNIFTEVAGETVTLLTEQRANYPRVDRELMRIRKTFYKLAILIMTSTDIVRKQARGYGCQDMVNHYFVFAREIGQRALRYLDSSRRGVCASKLVLLSIDWVSFVCDDCVASDKKTFQWSVNALEFAMQMTRGTNILTVSDEEFSRLRQKVAGCMTLLISHFDIMGARSSAAAALEQKKQEKAIVAPNEREADDESSLQAVRKERLRELAPLEEARRLQLEEQRSVGKVLDDSTTETQYLMFLTSSFSNVNIRWQQGRFIGGGSFGSVYAAVNLETGDLMAVKEIRLQDSQSIRHIVKSIKEEMTVLEMLSHPNIVQYYGVEVHREKVFIFMEYCQGGSLGSLLEHGRIEDESVIQVYTLQMLEGLAYLHEAGIVHRDIKPENILLDHMGVIKFVDFGAAKVIAKKGMTRADATAKTNMNSLTGTPMYMSPEVITGTGAGRQGSADIWSMGCCVLEMATGRRPWANLDNEWAIMYQIAAGHLIQLPTSDQMSEMGRQFLMRCFEQDPYKRASAIELLDDPWIRSMKMETLGADGRTPSTESETSLSPG
ncbi:uncharacterized protein V1518DRAFT_409305 [Limtongia smithiae]|uniref:uncharacterized protein n=1 Tax=Limtongia smithiae TaxID=1125753 RepID=UPI0034CFC843